MSIPDQPTPAEPTPPSPPAWQPPAPPSPPAWAPAAVPAAPARSNRLPLILSLAAAELALLPA